MSENEQPSRGELLAAISNLAVGVYAQYLGRGPTKARSYMIDDLVVCLMEDTMTKAETTLVAEGDGDTLLDLRIKYQQAMRKRVCEGIEELTSRRVRAFVSGNSLEPDIWAELFVLEGSPAGVETPANGLAG